MNELISRNRQYSASHVDIRWKIRTEDIKQKQTLLKLSTTQKKQTTEKTEQEAKLSLG